MDYNINFNYKVIIFALIIFPIFIIMSNELKLPELVNIINLTNFK